MVGSVIYNNKSSAYKENLCLIPLRTILRNKWEDRNFIDKGSIAGKAEVIKESLEDNHTLN